MKTRQPRVVKQAIRTWTRSSAQTSKKLAALLWNRIEIQSSSEVPLTFLHSGHKIMQKGSTREHLEGGHA